MGKKEKSTKAQEAPASPVKVAATAKKAGKAKTHRVPKSELKSFLNKICKDNGICNLNSAGTLLVESCISSLLTDLMNLSASTLKPKSIYRPSHVHQSAVALFQLRGMTDKNCQAAVEFSKSCLAKLETAAEK